MQVNVDTILQSATNTGEFRLVTADVFGDTEKYPAILVENRATNYNELSGDGLVYNASTEYTVSILVRDRGFRTPADGFTELERLTNAWLTKLSEVVQFELQNSNQFSTMLGAKDVFLNTITLTIVSVYDVRD